MSTDQTNPTGPLILADIPFLPSPHYTPAHRTDVSVIVLHTTENKQRPGLAADIAAWFRSPLSQVSAHYVVDDAQVVECVHPDDVAWAAPGANTHGLHIEHGGLASMTAQEWATPYSSKLLSLSQRLSAALCIRWGIPAVLLSADDLIAGKRGITTHKTVSDAYKLSNHQDPGSGFPLDAYITAVKGMLP